MKIRSAYTSKSWLTTSFKDTNSPDEKISERDGAKEQIQRSLAEIVRCQNLVVLAGLGTSLCLIDDSEPPKRKAPTMPDLWRRVKRAYATNDEQMWGKLIDSVRHVKESENIEELLSACKIAENFLCGDSLKDLQKFILQAESEILSAVNFLGNGEAVPIHSAFLQRIARRSAGKGRAKIFTTNYDLCFERAAKDGRFVVIDGFSPTLPPTFDPVYFTYDVVRRGSDGDVSAYIPNVFHLYKLHGSIDWERGEGDIQKKHDTKKPLLIYPRSSKYEQAFSQPYFEMMSALQAALREPNTGLLIIGFGFGDNHIAEPVLSAIRSNLGLKVMIVDPALVKSVDVNRHIANGENKEDFNEDDELVSDLGIARTNLYLKKIMSLMDQGDVRLTFLNAAFEDVVREIPDMVAETDLEKHMIRMSLMAGGSV